MTSTDRDLFEQAVDVTEDARNMLTQFWLAQFDGASPFRLSVEEVLRRTDDMPDYLLQLIAQYAVRNPLCVFIGTRSGTYLCYDMYPEKYVVVGGKV